MEIGIMQGRLLPKFKSQYQAHPIGYWQKEFKLAKIHQLKYIEFIFDSYLYDKNPIFDNKGIVEIKKIISDTGVGVRSICADIFMQWPIKNMTKKEESLYGSILEQLICNLSKLGGTDIVIPCVDKSSLKTKKDQLIIASFLGDFNNLCCKMDINLSLETDLLPIDFLDFISIIKNKKVRVNYDSGNSASLGYNFQEELKLYGDKISNIHIKDRKFRSGPILLGQGDAELKNVKDFISSRDYNGIVIFQAFRDNNPIETFKKQYDYFMNI